ncbi:CotY/CotZ family spore coat protein [Bacillus marinisedimentorum]|uniref:CotY/CotZ family spore coat protein n=1 Tax=Bacillus marinisedimentorum TaxID=1821260 RepID=UPI000872771D|nr:CotY/CotZ family spore coat protein [Bacillus marinisedimentorum]
MEGYRNENRCVKAVLEKIADAQRKITIDPREPSIQASIDESAKNKKNTIPFILYCGSKPFIAHGVMPSADYRRQKGSWLWFPTFLFRVKDIKGDCASLELLKLKEHPAFKTMNTNVECTPCCQLDYAEIDDLVPTGMHITVDVSCFSSIQCLPALYIVPAL